MLSFTHSQPEENEEIPDNLKDLFGGKKSSLGDTSTISDHSAQSSISEPDDGLPNEELTRVLSACVCCAQSVLIVTSMVLPYIHVHTTFELDLSTSHHFTPW